MGNRDFPEEIPVHFFIRKEEAVTWDIYALHSSAVLYFARESPANYQRAIDIGKPVRGRGWQPFDAPERASERLFVSKVTTEKKGGIILV
jgi:hypothetical protein